MAKLLHFAESRGVCKEWKLRNMTFGRNKGLQRTGATLPHKVSERRSTRMLCFITFKFGCELVIAGQTLRDEKGILVYELASEV